MSAEGKEFGSAAQAQFLLAQMTGKEEFTYKDVTYAVAREGEDFYSLSSEGEPVAIAYKDIVNAEDGAEELPFAVKYAALAAYTNGQTGAFPPTGRNTNWTMRETLWRAAWFAAISAVLWCSPKKTA